ncbi:hypothetical protein KQH60_08180 [Mycetohabitans sp. B8]|uniref:hypothetical protein n=1 Tax=Mycetohabitans sp. B8 TaxID=2841845 RepID=UPI001F21BD59|nr:hypothetical protein [Mycetohabitans sp. B8]MCG1042524.1 hypothetical protein [Mycetohabitans sp. B8]
MARILSNGVNRNRSWHIPIIFAETTTQHHTNDLTRDASMQRELNLKPEMQRVDIRCIDAQPSMTAAIRLCQQLSGLDDKKIVGKQGIVADVAQWSRITRSGQHYFPQDKLNAFMDLCHNEAPLIWLARSRGYELTPLETEMERRLRLEREKTDELERENMLLKKLLTGRME